MVYLRINNKINLWKYTGKGSLLFLFNKYKWNIKIE